MNSAQNTQIITTLFSQTRSCIEELHQCLMDEFNSLKQNETESLLLNSQQKEALMLQLHDYETKRKSLLRQAGIDSKEAYLVWLDSLDQGKALKSAWLDISKQILICQKQNSTNGIISEKMASATREVLGILSGRPSFDDSTYTAAGKKPGSISSLHNTTA